MVMMLFGAALIAYLLYFIVTTIRQARRDAAAATKLAEPVSPHRLAAEKLADSEGALRNLDARIHVLERLWDVGRDAPLAQPPRKLEKKQEERDDG